MKDKKIALLAPFLFLSGILPVFTEDKVKEKEPKEIARSFFTLVYGKKFEEAYAHFSSSVKKRLSPARFKNGAGDVLYLKVLDVKTLDKEANLVKVKMRVLVHLIYKKNVYEAEYEGIVDLFSEKGKWKIMTVDLEAKSQKLLKKKAPAHKLQKLDFGT